MALRKLFGSPDAEMRWACPRPKCKFVGTVNDMRAKHLTFNPAKTTADGTPVAYELTFYCPKDDTLIVGVILRPDEVR